MPAKKKAANNFAPKIEGDNLIFFTDLFSFAPDPVQFKPYNPSLRAVAGTTLLVRLSCPSRWVAGFDDTTIALTTRGAAYVMKQMATAISWMHSQDLSFAEKEVVG